MKFDNKETLKSYIYPDLIPFLKENDIYDKFMYNLRSHIANSYEFDRIGIPLNENSFIWNDTSDGGVFWSEISDKIYDKFGSKIYQSTEIKFFSDLKKLL